MVMIECCVEGGISVVTPCIATATISYMRMNIDHMFSNQCIKKKIHTKFLIILKFS